MNPWFGLPLEAHGVLTRDRQREVEAALLELDDDKLIDRIAIALPARSDYHCYQNVRYLFFQRYW